MFFQWLPSSVMEVVIVMAASLSSPASQILISIQSPPTSMKPDKRPRRCENTGAMVFEVLGPWFKLSAKKRMLLSVYCLELYLITLAIKTVLILCGTKYGHYHSNFLCYSCHIQYYDSR